MTRFEIMTGKEPFELVSPSRDYLGHLYIQQAISMHLDQFGEHSTLTMHPEQLDQLLISIIKEIQSKFSQGKEIVDIESRHEKSFGTLNIRMTFKDLTLEGMKRLYYDYSHNNALSPEPLGPEEQRAGITTNKWPYQLHDLWHPLPAMPASEPD